MFVAASCIRGGRGTCRPRSLCRQDDIWLRVSVRPVEQMLNLCRISFPGGTGAALTPGSAIITAQPISEALLLAACDIFI
ncbi:hypothetical protein GDO81_027480 [Engystomops pustulosus]|uniref:Uncharacterized protein n=1 Tax=Engystomops pustulosus TaxID=76066 RepID=A0AAV6ZFJ0_ENGPU|nr:hypothetical protein GDO81_027480 [Engystomops pustulosus]